jgi:hypothetical protein
MIICHGEVLFSLSLVAILKLSVLEWGNLSQDLGNFVIMLSNLLHTYPFGLHLFSFFNAHYSQVWSCDVVIDSLYVPFTDAELLYKDFFCFSLISILSSSYEMLSSTCSSLLE